MIFRLRMRAILATASLLLAAPAAAEQCLRAEIPAAVAAIADRYDARQAQALMRAMAPEAALPHADELLAWPRGDEVLILRLRGDFLCPDPSISRVEYDRARRALLGTPA